MNNVVYFRNAILVTDNTKDFSGLNLNLENWR